MGPRPFGRGRLSLSFRFQCNVICFNGAATFRSRKVCVVCNAPESESVLQWGRDLSVAEGRSVPHPARQVPCFNGAATFRSRKAPSWPTTPGGCAGASMGPRPFGRGRPIPTWRARPPCTKLQWGRDLSVAEGAANARRLAEKRYASMGPRPFGRGRTRLAAGKPSARRFNGAATFRSRKGAGGGAARRSSGRFNGAATFRSRKGYGGNVAWQGGAPLQWGRDLSVAEGVRERGRCLKCMWLQWGRDLSVAEGDGRPA